MMAVDLRKPRAILSHPKIHKDYADFHASNARAARLMYRLHLWGWVFVSVSSVGAVFFFAWAIGK